MSHSFQNIIPGLRIRLPFQHIQNGLHVRVMKSAVIEVFEVWRAPIFACQVAEHSDWDVQDVCAAQHLCIIGDQYRILSHTTS